MPRKQTEVVEEEKPIIAEEHAVLPIVETKPEALKEEPSGTVKVKVTVGTLQWEEGVFSKGDTFTVSKERIKLFDKNDIQIIEG